MDDGDGIKTEDLKHLFNPFFTTDKAGTGLGLYLSQAFCEANQARLLYIPEHEKRVFVLFRLLLTLKISCKPWKKIFINPSHKSKYYLITNV
ncbi:ATP-binding protein [Psychrobacter sp. KH172YL61]|uniref:ATP-binding protein n=1 Tax=Psychrobacter sp. KH172YL61 TaxID=2517899 RepID=UPI001F07FB8E|nr:ATP-binding protein [Psychrobacter sp. KH172YL61]